MIFMIFMWQALLSAIGGALSSGLARGASLASKALGSVATGAASNAKKMAAGIMRGAGAATGLGGKNASRYAALRMAANAKKMGAGLLARNALRGGAVGAASRIGLAGMAMRRARKQGKRVPQQVLGFLARDFLDLGKSLVGLPGKLKNFQDGIAQSVGGLNQFSGTIAQSQGQLYADRVRRTGQYARGIGDSEAYKNRSDSRLEDALLPLTKLAANVSNYVSGALKNITAFALKSTVGEWNPGYMFGEWAKGENTEKKIDAKTRKFVEDEQAREQKWLDNATPEKRKAYEEMKNKRDRGPDEWWTRQLPKDDDADSANLLSQMVANIAGGKYHTRLMSKTDQAQLARDAAAGTFHVRRRGPLPPLEDIDPAKHRAGF